jgi:hypothetical protein
MLPRRWYNEAVGVRSDGRIFFMKGAIIHDLASA